MKQVLFSLILFFGLLWIPAVQADDVSAIRNAAQGKSYAAGAQSPAAYALVQWYKLRNDKKARFQEAQQFLSRYPNFPDLYTIREAAEQSITARTNPQAVITYFDTHPPLSATGLDHYLRALLQTTQTAKTMQVLKRHWADMVMTPNEQDDLLEKYGRFLGSQDHERRLRAILPDKHYTASRRLAAKLGGGYERLVEAQIGLIENKPNVDALIAAVPGSLRNNDALVLARLQWRRKNNQDEGAIALLNRAPDAARLSDPEAWWQERHIIARRLMEKRQWQKAYALVSDHRQIDGFPYAQAEFVAGWIALRKIGKPWEAFQHFENLFNAVKSPISRSRGAYWAGLASETLDHSEIAMQWYQVAAKYQTTFYGQMAAQRINLPLGLLTPSNIPVSAQKRQAFKNDMLITAAMLLKRAGQNRDARQFLLAYGSDRQLDGQEYQLVAALAGSLGYNDAAVKIAKEAERQGIIMPRYLFPILPEAKNRAYAVHPAFIHGIIRQESAFDQYARSHAGALGLMQLMPATARETAGRLGMRYSESNLTGNPAYNMTLGAKYIAQMLDQFGGNRTLAIAAYNAGPGRVRGWIKEFGDPRDKGVDETDWIENIPVYETRNYVQRVTEALNVYANLIQ